jgi:hypothetical protein
MKRLRLPPAKATTRKAYLLRNIPPSENSSDVIKLDTSPPRSYKEALLGSQPQKE